MVCMYVCILCYAMLGYVMCSRMHVWLYGMDERVRNVSNLCMLCMLCVVLNAMCVSNVRYVRTLCMYVRMRAMICDVKYVCMCVRCAMLCMCGRIRMYVMCCMHVALCFVSALECVYVVDVCMCASLCYVMDLCMYDNFVWYAVLCYFVRCYVWCVCMYVCMLCMYVMYVCYVMLCV